MTSMHRGGARTAAVVLLAATAASVSAVSAGAASAAPSHDPSSHNSYPTVPGFASLPIPAGVAGPAIDASQALSGIIYAGR
jgi:hypothetical protein